MKDLSEDMSPPGNTDARPTCGACLSVKDAGWHAPRSRKPVLDPISFDLSPGQVLGIVGSNGAGKSTLLRLLYRYHRPTSGLVKIDDDDIWKVSARDTARKVAAVLQEQPTDFALTVREIVALGRTPHRTGFGDASGRRDADIIAGALERLDLGGFAERHLGTLSGGERQRVMVARALAQEPQLLVLDEPTNHLDIRYQLEVLKLIRDLPVTIVTSLHDLNMAADVCDDVLLLDDGKVVGFGAPEDVFSGIAISKAFHVTARREHLAPSNTKHMTFHL